MNEAASGFTDPTLDSARAFRALLDAMARPGRVVTFPAELGAPAPLLAATATVCLTLCDYDTPLWVEPPLRMPEALDYLRFHTGAKLATDIEGASFLICTPSAAADTLDEADRGTAEYPDQSATLIVQVASFAAGTPVTLSGPGIEATESFKATGLDAPFWEAVERNHQLFPLGCDVIFAAPDRIAALPRSTHVRIEGRA